MANAVMEKGRSYPENMATKLMVELDSCTHCGSCTQECSVATAFLELLNLNILPSERIASIKELVAGKAPDAGRMAIIQQGIHICTNCGRCTAACTSGIDLTNLWFEVKEALLMKSMPEFALLSPLSLHRALERAPGDEERYSKPIEIARTAVAAGWDREKLENKARTLSIGNGGMKAALNESLERITSAGCYRCMTCSASCPVVRNYPNAEEVLGLLPHQMMHAVGLGLWDLVFSSKMLWNCLGCYQCQENCPQCIGIADIICELKNEAVTVVAGLPATGARPSGKDKVS
jgi:heterodisulfide reductase subunit C